MLRGDLLRLVLCTALLATAARAVHLGEPGVGSQYQLFGRPITDTSGIHSRIDGGNPAVPVVMPAQVLALEGNAPQSGAPKAGADAARKCEADYLYSDVFGKCLPAPGKDGYIGAAEHEKGKGKGVSSDSAFVPIGSVTGVNMHMPLPLRTAALHQPPQPQPLPPQQPTPPAQTGSQPARAVAPVQQLRLACPAGFTFQPAMGTCIAPAQAMFGDPQALEMQAMRRGDDDDDDDNLRRETMMRARRRMRHRMFGRRFGGGPRILAPVFVFVLPPHAADRNATMRLGQHIGRVHEVHPSLVGGGTRDRDATTTPSAPAPAEKPIAKPAPAPAEKPIAKPAAPVETDKPKGSVTGAGEEPPKALRGAFVNPIVSGKALPLKDTATGGSEWQSQPLMATDERMALPPALQQRAKFISPFVAVAPPQDVAAV